MNFNKLFTTLTIFILGLVTFTAVASEKAHAQAAGNPAAEICQVDESFWDKVQRGWENIDLQRTAMGFVGTLATDGLMSFATNMKLSQNFKCIAYLRDEMGLDVPDLPAACELTETERTKCASLVNSYINDSDIDTGMGPVSGQAYGSLASIANATHVVAKEPIPVNMAYYIDRQTENVPFVNQAFAQWEGINGSTAAGYTGPLLDITFSLWRIVRNMAYALMAIIMVIVGIMIMTRKKINPQTMVSVQYAIPKVIIALVLITFSYPIGATIASLGWALSGSAKTIVYNLGGFDTLSAAPLLTGSIIVALVIGIVVGIMTGGVGFVTLALSSAGFIVALVIYIGIHIKVLVVYFQIITKTITSPLTFAMSAVPGNETKVTDWFKDIFVKMASLLGMKAIIAMTHLVGTLAAVESLVSVFETGLTAGGNVASAQLAITAIMMPFIIQFIFVFGYYQAWQLPKKLEGVFLNPKGRR